VITDNNPTDCAVAFLDAFLAQFRVAEFLAKRRERVWRSRMLHMR
jgi:hypothetical protein